MPKFYLLLSFFFTAFGAFAQNPAMVKGTVEDASGKSLPGATLNLLRSRDSSVVKLALADKSGQYVFEAITPGSYFVEATASGHGKRSSKTFELSGMAVTVPAISLQPVAKELGAVTVQSRRQAVEQRIDRTIINVEATVSNAGATALEVLEKSPGITLDKDGNISLKGKAGVIVLLDGRPSYLSGAELTNYLRNMPAANLDQIELMSNPSSRFDASGNAGIINIKVKKNKQKGFNGSITSNYSQWHRARLNNNLSLNYRSGRINLFATAGQGLWKNFEALSIDRIYYTPGTKTVDALFEQESRNENHNETYNARIGADIFLTSKTTVGAVVSGFYNPEKMDGKVTSMLMDPARKVDSIVRATSRERELWKNGSVNLNFRHRFDSTGREFTADLDYITYQSGNNQFFTNTTYSPTWAKRSEEFLRSDLPGSIDIYTARVDYLQSLKRAGKLEAGAKTSHVQTDNHALYYNVHGVAETTDYSKTNHFRYTENVSAAYVSWNHQVKKWGLQSGLRYEHTSYSGKQFDNPLRPDSSFNRSYGNLFPTVFVSYDAHKDHRFGLTVGRRINRPNYRDLNPFLFFLDKYTYQAGNPYIQPMFSNNIEVSHTYLQKLTTTLNYSRTENVMAETFEPNGDAIIVRKGNLAQQELAGISVNAQLPVAKWWNAMLYANYNYVHFKGMVQAQPVDIEATNLTMNINNQFTFNKGWTAEISGFYRGKGVWGQIYTKPMGQMNIGVGKQVLKGKGSVKLAVRDVLYTNFPRGNMYMGRVDAYFQNRRDSRQANLSVSYRFGKPIKGSQQRRRNSAEEERNRVGQ